MAWIMSDKGWVKYLGKSKWMLTMQNDNVKWDLKQNTHTHICRSQE